ncbi:hypothetical protein FA13DRAFT_1094015 [Coprinellus micaceus]|uniref:Uncharacterized protein n=1 Tax=Coprinellus micaceus TaxID=71717 RepID=A0A4Y7TS61_COPMI|nr:hypothetical protein FA13DRAFT_1094015 [Coprinellus micaceus]
MQSDARGQNWDTQSRWSVRAARMKLRYEPARDCFDGWWTRGKVEEGNLHVPILLFSWGCHAGARHTPYLSLFPSRISLPLPTRLSRAPFSPSFSPAPSRRLESKCDFRRFVDMRLRFRSQPCPQHENVFEHHPASWGAVSFRGCGNSTEGPTRCHSPHLPFISLLLGTAPNHLQSENSEIGAYESLRCGSIAQSTRVVVRTMGRLA